MPPEPRLSKGASYKNNPSSKALDKSGKIIKSGLPQNWPKPTDEDLAACPTRIVTFGDSQKLWFNTNFIRTSKYTVLSFFPKFMAQSFHPRKKMANVYFLLIAAMQCVPVISNTMGFPTVLFPLSFVIVVDAIFAILEDLDRHKADDRANATTCLRFNKARKVFEEITWAEVTVGDVCQIMNREVLPADMVILSVCEKTEVVEGRCYVETKSLDGETNLKMRRALKATKASITGANDIGGVGVGTVEMEHPNKLIDSFKGNFQLLGMEKEVIDPNNVLLRGCTLRNVDWAICIIVNTGLDTKIMMSNSESPVKQSSLEMRINQEIKSIVAFLIAICLLGAIGAFIWMKNGMMDNEYLMWEALPPLHSTRFNDAHVGKTDDELTDFALSSIVQFFYYFLLMANFVPVSLYTSMSTVKYFQSRFIESDLEIYHEESDTPTQVRTMALNEELGQISHVFSDKTGTLTCNIMDFRKCSVNGISYGKGVTEIGKAAAVLSGKEIAAEDLAGEEMAQEHAKMHQQPHVNFFDQAIRFDIVGARGDEQASALADFFTVLALCHSVVPEHVEETGEIKLSASSPDDEALVCGAKFFGFEFVDRTQGLAIIRLSNGELKRYQIIEMIEFNSTRKRMSVVVEVEGTIQLFCKGADTVMVDRLAWSEESLLKTTSEHMTSYAKEGLRTLMICRKTLDPEWFKQWHSDFKAASADLVQIEAKMLGKDNEIDKLSDKLEQGLKLVGASAIEDKLQDGVPEAIADMAKAGIKIWVLTGDKVETAINIAVACRLLQPEEYMEQIVIDGDTYKKKEKLKDKLIEAIKEYEDDVKEAGGNPNAVKPRALIIDGPALIKAMESDVKQYLLHFTQCCNAVVGCRVSPDQKRQMVTMVREGIVGVKTLAIGDGANDVAMIQAAHVGIGISGQEGMQAVNASDYAIAQFKYLRRLLLLHGRWNYRRISRLVCYTFYKNIVMAIVQFWFAFQTGYSGQKYYFEGGIQLFNIAYTGFPIMFLGIFDKDVDEGMLLRYPQLYNNGIRDAFFNTSVFMSWIIGGTLESLCISILPLYMLENNSEAEGQGTDMWMYGMTSFTIMICVVNVKLLLNQYQFPWFSIVATVLSIGCWFLTAWGFCSVPTIDASANGVFQKAVLSYNFWLTVLLITTMLAARDFFYKGYQRAFKPQLHHVLQELVSLGREDEVINIPSPPPPRMPMKEPLREGGWAGGEKMEESIEMLRAARRGTKTVSDYFHSPALGFAYSPADLQTVMEERNIVLGKKGLADDVKQAHSWRVMNMFGGGGKGKDNNPKLEGKSRNKSFGEGLDWFDEDDEESGDESDGDGGAKGEEMKVEIDPRLMEKKESRRGSDGSVDSGRWSMGF